MSNNDVEPALLQHLCRNFGLAEDQASRLVKEVINFYQESHQQFIVRRHQELQQQGWNNPVIFNTIYRELGQRRFPAPELTERQLRRIIYG